jgi:hypothetical protein
MAGTVLAAAVAALGASAAMAGAGEKVDRQGISFEIPEEIRNLVTVEDGADEDTIVAVYETASVDAAKALGREDEGAGFIFSISTLPEARVKELRCGDMSGMEVFAEDDDVFYVFNHPTDVRFVRESYDYDGIEEDESAWTKINEWADQEVRQEILANNPELDEDFYTNTYLDMLLARAAYEEGTEYELRSVEFGADPLDPATLSDNDFAEELAEDFTYEELPDAQAPDGEYEVLAFDVDGEEVRYDFFHASDSKNLIREVRKVGEEEYETLYQATAKDADDVDETTTDIMEEWCAAIANGGEVDD